MGTSRSYASSKRAFLESLELPPDSFEGELPRTAAQADVEVSRGTETLETTGAANRARAASVQDKGVRKRQLARVRLQMICSGSTPAVGVSLHVSVTSQQSTASPTPLPGCATALSDLLLLAGEIPSEKLLGLCLARVVT